MSLQTATANTAPRRPVAYSGDAYAYSLPGGFAKATPWAQRAFGARKDPGDIVVETDGKRTLLVTDVACDLPADWLTENKVVVLPIKLRFDGRSRTDNGEPQAALDFFRRDLDGVATDAQALPLSTSGTYDFIHAQLQTRTDFVLNVSLASHRGGGYLNSLTAAQNLMLQHGRERRQNGIARPFKMWVIDSGAALNGQGVLVAASVRALADGMTVPRVVQQLDALRKHVHTLAIPRNVSFFHQHNRMDGDAALNWLSYGVGKVLDRTPVVHAQGNMLSIPVQARSFDAAVNRALTAVTQHVRAGLLTPSVCVSYAGDVVQVRSWPTFIALEDTCVRNRVALHLGTMSMTNALAMGSGALTLSFASASTAI